MSRAAAAAGSPLIVVSIPYLEPGTTNPVPAPLAEAVARLRDANLSLLDLAPVVARHYSDPAAPLLRFDRDRHPDPAAHALFAEAIDAFVRDRGLLPASPSAR